MGFLKRSLLLFALTFTSGPWALAQNFYPHSGRVCDRQSQCRSNELCVTSTQSWVSSSRCRNLPYQIEGASTLLSYPHIKIDRNFLQFTPCQRVTLQRQAIVCHRLEQTDVGLREVMVQFGHDGLPLHPVTLTASHLPHSRSVTARFGRCDFTVLREREQLAFYLEPGAGPNRCEALSWNGGREISCSLPNRETSVELKLPARCLTNLGPNTGDISAALPIEVFDGPRIHDAHWPTAPENRSPGIRTHSQDQ